MLLHTYLYYTAHCGRNPLLALPPPLFRIILFLLIALLPTTTIIARRRRQERQKRKISPSDLSKEQPRL